MESIQYLYELLNKSTVTVIGYNYKHEIIKDELISRLSHSHIGEVGSSFNIKQILRDIKLKQILDNGSKFVWLVLDTSQITYDNKPDKIDSLMSKSKVIGETIESIRSHMYEESIRQQEESLGLDFDDPTSHEQNITYEPPYKLLITTPMYRTVERENGLSNFNGGTRPVYMADSAFVIDEKEKRPYLKILKNRFGSENNDISLDPIISTIERERKINKVLSDR